MMDYGAQNESWAARIVNALIQQGANYFCCAPGSRSTPLMLAIAQHPKAHKIVHFDERGVCFHALGFGKASGKPAVVVTTSGTAVGNLLPGVMEAYNDKVPLILLTADRPPELQGCGANQTCDQVKLFTNHIRLAVDLPCPDDRIPEKYLASRISHAVAMTQSSLRGPVHINCMFREPLFSSGAEPGSLKKHVHVEHPHLHPSHESIAYWAELLSTKKKGVIIAASSTTDDSEAIFALAERLKWPIFADILSRTRTLKNWFLITHFDPILKVKDSCSIDAVIQFGDRIVSKTLSQWLQVQDLEFYLHLSEHLEPQDPDHLVTHKLHASPLIFTKELLNSLPNQQDSQWADQCKKWDEDCRQTLSDFFSESTLLTEPSLIWESSSFLQEGWGLFLANSMPIRDANQFFPPLNKCCSIFGNRGVSGIDGNIATAAGIAIGMARPVLALIGDLAFLHDLNSLALLSKLEHPVVLCVVNNKGGGIFSFLPIAKKMDALNFEECFATSHSLSFASAATLFNLPYYRPETLNQFKEVLSRQKEMPQSCIIEISTDRAENVVVHQQIQNAIKSCLNTSQKEILTTLI